MKDEESMNTCWERINNELKQNDQESKTEPDVVQAKNIHIS